MSTIHALSVEMLSEVFLAVARVNPPWLHFTGRVQAPGWFSITQVCRKWRAISLSLHTLWAMTWADVPNKMLEWVARAGEASLHIRMPYPHMASNTACLPALLIERGLARRVVSISLKYSPAALADLESVLVGGITYPPKQIWSCIRLQQLEHVEICSVWLDGGFPHSALKSFTLHRTRAPVSALVDDIIRPQKDSLESLVIRNGLIRTVGQDVEADRIVPVELERMAEMDVTGILHEVALLLLNVKLGRKIKTLVLRFFRDDYFTYQGEILNFAHLVHSLHCIESRCDLFRVNIACINASVNQYYIFDLEAWFVDEEHPARERVKLPPNVFITFRGMEFDKDETSPLCPADVMLQIWIDAMRCKDRTVNILFLDLSTLYGGTPETFDWGRLENMEARWVAPYAPGLVVGWRGEAYGNQPEEERILALQNTSVLFED